MNGLTAKRRRSDQALLKMYISGASGISGKTARRKVWAQAHIMQIFDGTFRGHGESKAFVLLQSRVADVSVGLKVLLVTR